MIILTSCKYTFFAFVSDTQRAGILGDKDNLSPNSRREVKPGWESPGEVSSSVWLVSYPYRIPELSTSKRNCPPPLTAHALCVVNLFLRSTTSEAQFSSSSTRRVPMAFCVLLECDLLTPYHSNILFLNLVSLSGRFVLSSRILLPE